MTMIFLAMALLAPAAQDPQAKIDYVETQDIVVTAVRNDCRVRLADQTLTDSQFNAHAREWAQGKPVRVIARANSDLKCLSKIAFKLADRGVKRIEFVDPSGRDAEPLMQGVAPVVSGSSGNGGGADVQDSERRFFASRAAKLILAGQCGEARRQALAGGDLDTAAKVATICRAP